MDCSQSVFYNPRRFLRPHEGVGILSIPEHEDHHLRWKEDVSRRLASGMRKGWSVEPGDLSCQESFTGLASVSSSAKWGRPSLSPCPSWLCCEALMARDSDSTWEGGELGTRIQAL